MAMHASVTRSAGAVTARAMRRLMSTRPEDGFKKVAVIGHRGASGWMPDHTLPTYQKAFEKGADWLELDAHCTSDGQLVSFPEASGANTSS